MGLTRQGRAMALKWLSFLSELIGWNRAHGPSQPWGQRVECDHVPGRQRLAMAEDQHHHKLCAHPFITECLSHQ